MRLLPALLILLVAGTPAASARTVEIGTAINNDGFAGGGQAYRDALLRHDAFTAESAMKMLELQPARGSYNFARADGMVSWARANGKQIHGHNLVWCADQWTPAWVVQGSWTRATLLAVMQDHIRTVMRHWEGQIPSWDVVNEAIEADGSMRDCVWRRVIGPDWVEQAFKAARAADPTAKLYLNEFGADTPGARFNATEALARDFKARGVPLDGIGLQYHVYGREPFQYLTEEVLRRIGALGLTAHISELDDKTSPIAGTLEEKLAKQGQTFQTIASACQAVPACTRVTTWGVSDAWSWRGPAEMAVALDSNYGEKPAWAALQQELHPALPRRPAAVGAGDDAHRRQARSRHLSGELGPGAGLRGRPAHVPARAPRRRRRRLEPGRDRHPRHRLQVRRGRLHRAGGDVALPRPRGRPDLGRRLPDLHRRQRRRGRRPREPERADPHRRPRAGVGRLVPRRGRGPLRRRRRPGAPRRQPRLGAESDVGAGAAADLRNRGHGGQRVGQDRSGNASPSVTGSFRVDADAPVATADTGAYEPGSWTSSDVTVTFTCSDEGAGLAGAAPAAAVVSGEGAGQLRSADCVDRVGHVTTAQSGAISIDKSAPTGALTCPESAIAGSRRRRPGPRPTRFPASPARPRGRSHSTPRERAPTPRARSSPTTPVTARR